MAAVPKGFMPNISGFQASEAVSTVALRAPFETASEARPPNPEFVPVRCTRRQCSVPEKTALLAEADECEARGDLGGCLRRRRYARRCFTGGACGLLRTLRHWCRRSIDRSPILAAGRFRAGTGTSRGCAANLSVLNRLSRRKNNSVWRWICRSKTRRATASEGRGQ